jgi:hypothetical protein
MMFSTERKQFNFEVNNMELRKIYRLAVDYKNDCDKSITIEVVSEKPYLSVEEDAYLEEHFGAHCIFSEVVDSWYEFIKE